MHTHYRRILSQLDAPPVPTNNGHSASLSFSQTQSLLGVVRRMLDESDRVSKSNASERRRSRRRPYPQRVLITPCLAFDLPRFEESEAVVAKDLSTAGLSFVHARRLTDRRILVTLPGGSALPICMAAELRHQSAAKQGLYVIGLRFLQRVTLQEHSGPLR